MSLLSLILKEKDPNGNVRQLCGSDLSKISESELEDYLLNVRRTNLDLSRTRLTRRQLRTVTLETIWRFFIIHIFWLQYSHSLIIGSLVVVFIYTTLNKYSLTHVHYVHWLVDHIARDSLSTILIIQSLFMIIIIMFIHSLLFAYLL